MILSKHELDENNQDHVGNELSQPGPECHIDVNQILGSSIFDSLCEKNKNDLPRQFLKKFPNYFSLFIPTVENLGCQCVFSKRCQTSALPGLSIPIAAMWLL